MTHYFTPSNAIHSKFYYCNFDSHFYFTYKQTFALFQNIKFLFFLKHSASQSLL